MKKRKEKTKKSKIKNLSKIKIEKDITKQVGIFNDFLVYDKIDEMEKKDLNFLFNDPKDQPTQSRFINLFQEILEDDKKKEKKKENINLINNEIN